VESSVKLTFYGGLNKVGGNKVLLEDFGYNVKLFIDFGINSAEFAQAKTNHPDPTEVGQLTYQPDVKLAIQIGHLGRQCEHPKS